MRNSEPRIYGLDILRSTMMILGIVLHTSLTYGPATKELWLIHDTENSGIFFDILALLIHYFRIPVFFFLGGFFCSYILRIKGQYVMIVDRFKRILIPAVVFNVILWPINYYSHFYALSNTDSSILNNTMLLETYQSPFIPANSLNLWFLYYYFLIILLVWIVIQLKFPVRLLESDACRYIFSFLTRSAYAFISITLLIFAVLLIFKEGWIVTKPDFKIHFPSLVFYSIFFISGWILCHKREFMNNWQKDFYVFLIIGMIAFLIRLLAFGYPAMIIENILGSIICVSFLIGFVGLFMKHFNTQNKLIRYLSDASYWIYLVHVPIVVFFAGFFCKQDFGAFVKFTLVCAFSFSLSLFSYHYVVKNTFIGRFLKGNY